MRIRPITMGALMCLIIWTPSNACLWDHDTLLMERERFPGTLELITGKFLRHTPEFYHWRVQDRIRKLKSEPHRLDYMDDLAVAYEKTGDHQKAIEIMLEKEKEKPGEYETVANLGTFYIHAGELEKGLTFIDRAIDINPKGAFWTGALSKIPCGVRHQQT